MKELSLYAAISRFGQVNYRVKIMIVAFLGTHIPLLAIIGFYVFSSTSDTWIIWSTLAVALVATLLGTAVTLFALNQLLQPVILTSRALRAYRTNRVIAPLPVQFTDEAGTLMADAVATLTRLEETVIELETTDKVTGLPNRGKFESLVKAAMGNATPPAIAAVRLTNFSGVAATYDQDQANVFARNVAAQLADSVGAGTPLARIEPDMFAFIEPASRGIADRMSNVLAASTKSVALNNATIVPDLAMGVAIAPDDGATAHVLVDHAFAAATASPARAVSFHSPAARQAARERFELEQALRGAIERREFELNYQPVVDIRAGKVIGTEALIRWRRPQMGLVSPGIFIPTAERSGLIDTIGLWVMREACSQVGRWMEENLDPLSVAINVSARQFHDPRLTDYLAEAIGDAKVDPARLEIELTESAATLDYDHTRRVFSKLSDMGVSVAIDDFGTGYASMSQLRKLPFNKLKIDREFVTDVDTARDGQAICAAMIALGHGLGLKVLAEGTERAEEVQYLMANGCDLFQGYHFSRPVAASAMAETLADIRMIAATFDVPKLDMATRRLSA